MHNIVVKKGWMFCDPVLAYSAASMGPESFKSSGIHVFDNIVLVLGVIQLLNNAVKDFDTKKSARLWCGRTITTPRPAKREIKMDCVELCGGVHTTQRQTLVEIPIGFCAILSVLVSVSGSGNVNAPQTGRNVIVYFFRYDSSMCVSHHGLLDLTVCFLFKKKVQTCGL